MLWVTDYAKGWTLIVRAHPSIPLSQEEVEKLSVLDNLEIHDPVVKTLDDSLDECKDSRLSVAWSVSTDWYCPMIVSTRGYRT